MGERVVDLANVALDEGTEGAVVGVLVAAARRCAEEEARGDVRDGLIDMPLPFRAAELLGLDLEALVERALELLDGRAADCLRSYAARPDRCDVRCMGWREEQTESGVRFAGWGA
ncbi:MAG: hypothetical protein ACRC50_04470 [Gaiella sp.]